MGNFAELDKMFIMLREMEWMKKLGNCKPSFIINDFLNLICIQHDVIMTNNKPIKTEVWGYQTDNIKYPQKHRFVTDKYLSQSIQSNLWCLSV